MAKFQIYREQQMGEQCWCWRLLDGDNHPIANGNTPFMKDDIHDSIKKVKVLVDESGSQGFTLSGDGQNWHLKDDQDEIIVVSETDVSEPDRQNYFENLCREISDAEISWENEEDDPAYQAKHDDTTETKGVPGS